MHIQQWVKLADVSNGDAKQALAAFGEICAEHGIDEDTADTLWAASQIVLCHLLKENGELPARDELPELTCED